MIINKIIIVTTISFFSVVLSCGLSQPAFAGTFPGANGKIAYEIGGGGGDNIYIMNPDGTGVTQLTFDTSTFHRGLSWSPDGTNLAYDVIQCTFSSCTTGGIHIIHADGSGSGYVGGGASPSWSPDGKMIAFAGTGGYHQGIYVMNADETGVTELTYNYDSQPNWSPDGTRIAYQCPGSSPNIGDICAINPDGTGFTDLTNNICPINTPNCGYQSTYPSWSPDGKMIVFASNVSFNYANNIYIMNADGTGITNLTNMLADQFFGSSWSPDGTRIAITLNDGNTGIGNVYAMNIDGTGLTQLTSNTGYGVLSWSLAWQPTPKTTTLTLNSISPVPWNNKITVSGKLVDQLGHNVSGATISFNGTGGGSIANATTDVNGLFTTTGTALNSVRTGWTVQAHYAGDTLYLSSNSLIQNYNTVKHTVSLALTKPANVPWSRPTALTGSLTDTIAGGAISAKTISFTGTGVIGVANVNTNATGVAVGHGTSPSTVSAGLTAQAHFAGDALYNAADSTVQTFNTLRHNVSLGLSPPANVPWSRPTSFVTVLTDTTSGNTVISGAPISFTGTGVIGVANVNTNATGVAVGHGTSPSTVSAGLTAQAHFAGNGHYNAADSLVKTYNILAHSTSLALSLSPSTVLHGTPYNVTGTLMDVTANVPLGSQTVTFTATAPITIPSQVTSTTGAYSAIGRIAPSTSGSYGITSHFAATSLYGASNSPTRTLIVS